MVLPYPPRYKDMQMRENVTGFYREGEEILHFSAYSSAKNPDQFFIHNIITTYPPFNGKGQASLLIILPQAIRNALPTIGNELIVNIKDSSVLNIIAVAELFYRFKDIATTNYAFLECYLLIAAIYLVLTIIASIAIKLIEKKLDGNKIFTNVFAKKEEF